MFAFSRGVSVVVLGLIGCGESSEQPGFTVRDSTGIAIGTSSTGAWARGPTWSLSDHPALILAGTDAGQELWQIRDYVRAADGSIALLSGGTSRVLVFDASGKRLRTFGREGGGPGEFTRPAALALAGPDTLLVLDGHEIEVFRLDGTWLSSHRVAPLRGALGVGNVATPTMVAPDGSILAMVLRPRGGPPPGMHRPDLGLAVLPSGGHAPVFLGWYGGIEQERLEGPRGGNVIPPFARSSVWSIGASTDAQFLVADNARYDIHVFNNRGTLRQIVRRDYEPVAVTEEWVEQWKTVQRAASWNQERLAALERAWARMKVHETLPTLESLAADALGNLWVLRPTPHEDGDRSFDVFEPQGRFLGEVRIPGRAEADVPRSRHRRGILHGRVA